MLSVAIIARDEERHIAGALESVAGLASEVVVLLDSRTRDGTAAIGHAYGACVLVEPWRGFPAQRNRALDLCVGDWVLFLDADERVTPELRAEIRDVLAIDKETRPAPSGNEGRQGDKEHLKIEDRGWRMEDRAPSSILHPPSSILHPQFSAYLTPSPPHPFTPSQAAGYWIPRYNRFFGKILRGGGWYPDHQLRLLRRGRARYDEARLVHELVRLDGVAGELHGHLLHLNIERLDELWRKQTGYALQEAQTLYLAGGRARWRSFAGAPLREFYRRYITLGGARDGALGLFLCATLAYFEWVKYVHLKGLELAR